MANLLFILFVTLCTIGSQMILKRGVNSIINILKSEGALPFILSAATSPIVIAAIALQGVGYVVWLFVVAQERLSSAFAISGSFFYLIMALASWFFYDEKLAYHQWLGLVFITVGVILVTAHHGVAR